MAQRTKEIHIEKQLGMINKYFWYSNKTKKLTLAGRYGYKALDWSDGNTLITGKTKSEIYDICYCINSVLYELTKEKQ